MHYGKGKFAELIIIEGSLTEAEEDEINTYLNEKWGLNL